MKMIRMIPGGMPEVIDVGDPYDDIPKLIDGVADTFQPVQKAVILFDYHWQKKNKPFNRIPGLPGLSVGGTILVAGHNEDGVCELEENLDSVLWMLFRTLRYTRMDRRHNDWKCRRCGHTQVFEADGPYENGWNVCPSCGGFILRPAMNREGSA